MLEQMSAALDRLVGIISPRNALKRVYYRKALKRYAAAEDDRLTGGWSPTNTNVNDLIRGSSSKVRGRVRQLVRDFPFFKRAVQIGVDYTVGGGILYQSRILRPDGKLDKRLNQEFEDAFKFWADEADVAGKLHFYEMMNLAKRQDMESGEFILAFVKPRRPRPYLNLALQMFEAEWLADTPAGVITGGNYFDQGIEYHKGSGYILAYHFTDPESYGRSIRIPAKDVVHGFETLRPGQLRGISPFTPAIMLAHDIGELIISEVDAAKMASKYLAIVTAENPAERQTNIITDTETNKKLDVLENAVIEYLRPGEKIDIATNPRPDSNLYNAVTLLARMISITVGLPFELLAGDYTGFSWSTGRISRNDFAQQLRPISLRHIRQYCLPVARAFYDRAIYQGKVTVPYAKYMLNNESIFRSEWQPPGMDWIDPLKESKAALDQVKSLQKSPQEFMRARGKDPEEVLKDIADFRDMAKDYKLGDFFDALFQQKISTATANNPDAVMNDQGKSSKQLQIVRGT
jgi:lambda family phage portal protein